MVVVGREVPVGRQGLGWKESPRRETAGAPVSGQADASVATEALEGPELDEQDEGSTETDDGAGGNVEDLDRDNTSGGVVQTETAAAAAAIEHEETA